MDSLAKLVGEDHEVLSVDGQDVAIYVPKHSDAIKLQGDMDELRLVIRKYVDTEGADPEMINDMLEKTSNYFYRLVAITTKVTMEVAETRLQQLFIQRPEAIPVILEAACNACGMGKVAVDYTVKICKNMFLSGEQSEQSE